MTNAGQPHDPGSDPQDGTTPPPAYEPPAAHDPTAHDPSHDPFGPGGSAPNPPAEPPPAYQPPPAYEPPPAYQPPANQPPAAAEPPPPYQPPPAYPPPPGGPGYQTPTPGGYGPPPPGYGQTGTPGGPVPPAGGRPPGPQDWFAGANEQRNRLGLISVILGVLAILYECCIGAFTRSHGGSFLNLVLVLGAIILGYLHLQKVRRGEASNATIAKIGIGLGVIGLVFTLCFGCTGSINTYHNNLPFNSLGASALKR